MKTIKLVTINLLLAVGLIVLFNSCKKEAQSPASTSMVVRMTDAPVNIYSAVNVDIQAVEVIVNGGSAIQFRVNPGVYNLLDFANGRDTIIANGSVPTGVVSQIRLILGNNNTVEMNGQTYPLKTPSAQQSGLKLNLHAELVEGVVYVLRLDFDAGKSVVEEGNGNFLLKPVIRVIDSSIHGSIHGQVLTMAALPVAVLGVIGTDTISTITATDGQFFISGAPEGIYTIELVPSGNILSPKIMNSVTVSTGHVTEVGPVTF